MLSGLWYAKNAREKAEKSEEQNLPSISMNANQVHNVGRTLNSLDGGGGSGARQNHPPSRDDQLGQEWDQRLSFIKKLDFDEGAYSEDLWMRNYLNSYAPTNSRYSNLEWIIIHSELECLILQILAFTLHLV